MKFVELGVEEQRTLVRLDSISYITSMHEGCRIVLESGRSLILDQKLVDVALALELSEADS